MTVSRCKVQSIIMQMRLQGIEKFEGFNLYSESEISKVYNGIGPDRFPAEVRDRVTEEFAVFEPATLVHDVEYDHIIKLYAEDVISCSQAKALCHVSNERMRRNHRISIAYHYPWYRFIRRAQLRAVSDAFFYATEVGGFKGIQSAVEARVIAEA